MVHEHIGPFSPTNATASTIWSQQAALDGAGFGHIAYGVHFTLFLTTLPLLWRLRDQRRSHARTLIAYVFALFALGTISNFANMRFIERQFVDDVNYPGGPSRWQARKRDVVGTSAYVVNMWLQDFIVIHRFFVIFGYDFWPIIAPCLCFLAAIVLSGISLPGLSHPDTTHLPLARLTTAYTSISVGTTAVISLLIIVRMMRLRSSLRNAIGAEHAAPYLSLDASLVESVAMYSVFALPHAVLLGLGDSGQLFTAHVVSQVQSIAPLLIIRRIAQGRAWSRDTVRYATARPGHLAEHEKPTAPLQFADPSEIASGAATAAMGAGKGTDAKCSGSSRTAFTEEARDARGKTSTEGDLSEVDQKEDFEEIASVQRRAPNYGWR